MVSGQHCCCAVFVAVDSGSHHRRVEHFERKVRPILVEHCQSCHVNAGGVSAAMGDASVTFMADAIDAAVFAPLVSRDGG